MLVRISTLSALVVGLFGSANAYAQEAAPTVPEAPPPPPPPETAQAPSDPPPATSATLAPIVPQPFVPTASMWGPAIDVRAKPTQRWYGWQTLLIMLPFDLLGIVGHASNDGIVTAFSYVGWYPVHLWVGPIVHWAHGNIGKGFAAFGTNALIPALSAGFGVLVTGRSRSELLEVTSSLGILAAQALDIALFAWEPATEAQTAPKGAQALLPSSVMALPNIDANHAGVVFVGQF